MSAFARSTCALSEELVAVEVDASEEDSEALMVASRA